MNYHRFVGACRTAIVVLLSLLLLAACRSGDAASAPLGSNRIKLSAFPDGIGRGYASVRLPVDDSGVANLGPGEPVPDIVLALESGEYASFADLKGTPVIVNFWATWCGPCRLEMPDLVQAAQSNQDLVVLAVNVQESLEQIAPFAREFDMTMPIVLDREGSMRERFGVRGLPMSFFVDRDGTVASVYAGPLTPKMLQDRLNEIQ